MAILDDYINETELAAELGHHPRTLARWRALREGPPHTRIGRKILYLRESVQFWLRPQEVEPARLRRERR